MKENIGKAQGREAEKEDLVAAYHPQMNPAPDPAYTRGRLRGASFAAEGRLTLVVLISRTGSCGSPPPLP
jgi:hypothetical protein